MSTEAPGSGKQPRTYKIKKFDPRRMKKSRLIFCIGRKGTGKTHLLQDLMYHVREHYDHCLVMSPTASTREALEEHVPESVIHDCYDEGAMWRTWRKLREMDNEHKRKRKAQVAEYCRQHGLESLPADEVKRLFGSKHARHTAVVLDDCMFDKKILKHEMWREIALNGRHSGICVFNCVQYMMDLDPTMRQAIDYVFILKHNENSDFERLYDNFAGMFPSKDQFASALRQITQDHGVMVIDKTQPSNRMQDTVYFYRAQPTIPPYVFGKVGLWKLHTQYYLDTEARRQRDREQAIAKRRQSSLEDDDQSFDHAGVRVVCQEDGSTVSRRAPATRKKRAPTSKKPRSTPKSSMAPPRRSGPVVSFSPSLCE